MNPLAFLQNLGQGLSGLFGPQTFTDLPQRSSLQSQATTPKKSSKEDIEKKIRSGLKQYSKGKELPIEKYIPQMVAATERYPIFQQYPYLIPAVSIVETSGGANWRRLNNPLSWGARAQAAGLYNPQSVEQSIEDFITAVGGDINRGPAGSDRQRQIEYYRPFREKGDISLFANTYEPPENNPNYLQDLLSYLALFENQ